MGAVSSIVKPVVSGVVHPIVISEGGAAAPDSLLTDLVAWWSLDEVSGTRVNAHNPGTHDLTDNNTVGSTTGVVGDAASFVAANSESLSTNHHADFVIADTPFSVAGWAEWSTASAAAARIISKGRSGSPGGEWSIVRSANSVTGEARNAANAASVATGFLEPGYDTWFFFIFEHLPDSNQIKIEVNRASSQTAALVGGTYSSTNAIHIGSRVGADYIDGAIDNVVVARRLWTSEEKDRLYNSGAGMAYPA